MQFWYVYWAQEGFQTVELSQSKSHFNPLLGHIYYIRSNELLPKKLPTRSKRANSQLEKSEETEEESVSFVLKIKKSVT